MRLQVITIALYCCLAYHNAFGEAVGTAADTIYHNGSIITMVGNEPSYVEAVAVTNGRIAHVGSKTDALRLVGDTTRIVDLGGKTMLPGFLDSHSHYMNSLLVANQCQLYAPPSGPGKDVPSIVAELKRYAEERDIPKGELIIGYGYDDTVMPNGRLLNRDDLDAAFPDNPVRVDHVSMHGAVLNSLALEKYGYSAETETPPGGVIVRKPGSNEPYGLIMETAYLPVLEKSEPMTAQQEIEWTRAGQLLYAKEGITTAHEGATHLSHFQALRRTSEAQAYIIDVVAYPFITDVDKIIAEYPVTEWGKYSSRLKIGGVKITMDGSPQGRTAFFTTPYLTGGPGGEEDWTGEPTFPQDLANRMLKKVYDLGVPLNLHCNGDAAIDAFLVAYDFARDGDYSRPWNVTTIHTQFLREDQIPAFVKFNVRPSFYTLHTYYFAEAHLQNRGQEQAMYISPMRDAIDAGLRPTNHTDFVVAPLDSMLMLWSAVNRISRSGTEIGSDQGVTPYEGLKSMTEWVAEQYEELDSKGTLETGKLADLVILDKNPLMVEPMAIRDIKILETIKEGLTIYPEQAEDSTPVFARKLFLPEGEAAKVYSWTAVSCDMSHVHQAAHREWTLTRLYENDVTPEKPPTMKFEGGRVYIFGGINRLSGSYALIGDSVYFGSLASTKMAGDPVLMKLESDFATALASVDAFRFSGNELILSSEGTVVAEFHSEQ